MRFPLKTTVAFICVLVFLVALVGCASKPAAPGASGAKFPSKPITLLNSGGIGGSTDTQTRAFAPFWEKTLGQPLVIQQGESGMKTRLNCYQSKNDGYTILVTSEPSFQIEEILKKPGFESAKFTFLNNLFGNSYCAIAVRKDSPYKTYQELVEASKAKPIIVGGGGGFGGTTEVASIFFGQSGLKHEYVPYEGGEIITALLGGENQAVIAEHTELMNYADRIRLLAVLAPKRVPECPDVTTLAELGYPTMVVPFTIGFLAPPGMPQNIVDVYNSTFLKAVDDPGFQKWAKDSGARLQVMSGEDHKKMSVTLYQEIMKYKDLFRKQ